MPDWADGKEHTIPEAAAALGISVDGVRKRLARGTLQSYRNGSRRMVLIPYVELERHGRDRAVAVPDAASTPVPAGDSPLDIIVRQGEELGRLREENRNLRLDIRALERVNRLLRRQLDQASEAPTYLDAPGVRGREDVESHGRAPGGGS